MITDHFLVPKQVLLSKKQIEQLLREYGLKLQQMPRISQNDPAIKELEPKKGDVVKIVRDSPTAGKTIYYRRVV